jgi:hypothetical protein
VWLPQASLFDSNIKSTQAVAAVPVHQVGYATQDGLGVKVCVHNSLEILPPYAGGVRGGTCFRW